MRLLVSPEGVRGLAYLRDNGGHYEDLYVILDEDIRLGCAASGELQQELDPQTGSANAGFTAENLGVGDDEIFYYGGSSVAQAARLPRSDGSKWNPTPGACTFCVKNNTGPE